MSVVVANDVISMMSALMYWNYRLMCSTVITYMPAPELRSLLTTNSISLLDLQGFSRGSKGAIYHP